MDNCPKLLPLWHDVALSDIQKKCSLNFYFDPRLYPDHGGAGLDVSVNGQTVEHEELKCSRNRVEFGASTCCSPFLPPNKVESLKDPCLAKLTMQNKNAVAFTKRLAAIRNNMKGNLTFRKSILSAHSDFIEETNPREIFIPNSVYELAKMCPKQFPVPRARWKYSGGCLSINSHCINSPMLLHPAGKKMNRIGFTVLQEKLENSTNLFPTDNQKSWELKGGRIFQIASDSSLDVCCVRQKMYYHFLRLIRNEEMSVSSCSMETYDIGEPLSYIQLSNYVPGEHLVITKSGRLLLQNADSKKLIWKSKSHIHDPFEQDSWWNCDFGSHPRSVLYSDRLKFSSLDLRIKRRPTAIVSVPNPFFLNSEQIMVTRKLVDHGFQHLVATNYHLLIFDERYPQQPVMSWKHMLETLPLYCDVKRYKIEHSSSEHVVLLATQETQSIAAFHLRSSADQIQPLSLTHPMHLSTPKDITDILRNQFVNVDDEIVQRLSSPVIGVTVFPFSQTCAYDVLQINCLGDVFHQTFSHSTNSEKSHHFGPGFHFDSSDKISSAMTQWILNAKLPNGKTNNEIGNSNHYRTVNKTEILDALKKSIDGSEICEFCNSYDKLHSNELTMCTKCGLNFMNSMTQLSQNLGVVSSKTAPLKTNKEAIDFFPLVDLQSVSDPFSNRLLEKWIGARMQQDPVHLGSQIIDSNTFEVSFHSGSQSTQTASQQHNYSLPLDRTENDISESFDLSQDLFPSQKRRKTFQIKCSSGF